MLSYYVIPFFLAVNVPSPPYHEDVSPEYTFVAHVTTTAILNNPQADMPVNTPNRHIMTIEFKCRTHELEALLCHIGKHKQYPTKMRSLVNISDNYQKTKFQIRFNKDGVVDYAVERTYDDTMDFLLNLFRFFGSQLNVGVELNPYKDVYADSSTFKSTEQSVIGSCLTHFDINHLRTKDETLDKSTYLSLDEYYYFEYKDALRISKQRYAQDCHTTSSYMFSSSFWSEFLPDNVGEDIISSHSVMTLSRYTFQSITQNSFNLYDQNTNLIGNAVENIEVTLKSVVNPVDFPSRILLKPILGGVIAEGSIN